MEQANAELRVQVKSKSLKVENLESENFIMQGNVNADTVLRLKEVIKEKAELNELVTEMTEFLADYGLQWKGVDSSGEEEQKEGHFNF